MPSLNQWSVIVGKKTCVLQCSTEHNTTMCLHFFSYLLKAYLATYPTIQSNKTHTPQKLALGQNVLLVRPGCPQKGPGVNSIWSSGRRGVGAAARSGDMRRAGSVAVQGNFEAYRWHGYFWLVIYGSGRLFRHQAVVWEKQMGLETRQTGGLLTDKLMLIADTPQMYSKLTTAYGNNTENENYLFMCLMAEINSNL